MKNAVSPLFGTILVLMLVLVSTPMKPAKADQVPEGLKMHQFSGSELTPCPACLASDPYGNVYVGVDLLGSLGKGPGAGRIIRLRDVDGDGTADEHSLFANIDNPRGIIPIGNQVIVLHTEIPSDTKVLTGMHLSVLKDENFDGVADGPPEYLVRDISVAESNRKRGADHTTNGITLGIDGWIYIAVGDFGMVDATGADGNKITMLGGGIVRVRPDGTEFEVYTHGLRNIYDVAVDPFMNVFTRGNTNDGGGWNIRFIDNIQSGQYGYPILFKNFTDEIIPALVDLGGGSGTGALFFQEPGWPEKYNNVPMMCDWGRSHLYIHRVTPDGPSFTQSEERFIEVSQITDAACDASGRLYLGAWDRAGFKGNPEKGYVVTVTPNDWSYKPFPHLSIATPTELVDALKSESATARLYAQQEILTRQSDRKVILPHLKSLAENNQELLESRVAAIFTLKQYLGSRANRYLAALSLKHPDVREWAIRAITDRKSQLDGTNENVLLRGLRDKNPRVQVTAAVALGRLGNPDHAARLLASAKVNGDDPLEFDAESEQSKPAYTSRQVKREQSVNIKLDIAGWKELYLGVGDSNDGDGNDHGSWFEPTIVMKDGSRVPLTDLQWKSAKGGWGKTLVNKDCTGNPLQMANGKPVKWGIGSHAPSLIVYDLPDGAIRFESRAGMSSSAGGNGTTVYFVDNRKLALKGKQEGPHATPNPEIILPHVAVQSVISLNAVDAALESVGTNRERAGLWALKYMHDTKAVDGLIQKFSNANSSLSQKRIATTLIRLYHREQQYDGTWWWGTRPDTRGPYYRTETWEASPKIAAFIKSQWDNPTQELKSVLQSQLLKHRVEIDGVDLQESQPDKPAETEPEVDLAAIASQEGEIGKMAIEDVIIALDKVKGNPAKGRELYTKQGCIACHTLDKDEALKGPFMGHIGGIMKPAQIAEAILKPNATISQGFATFLISTKDGGAAAGFITAESADEVEIRDITGRVTTIKTKEIKSRQELEVSMMPPGLASSMSLNDFASLVAFLANQKN